MGRAWIVKEAVALAEAEGLSIENASWALHSKGKVGLPEEALCFDHKGQGLSVRFSDDEIHDCTPPAYESVRSLVTLRLKEMFRRLKRENS